MSDDSAIARSLRAASSAANADAEEDHGLSGSGSRRQGRSERSETDRRREKLCYWCHEPLPPLPEDASYVDEINHYIHDDCRAERDENHRRMDELRAGIGDGSIDSIPEVVRQAVLDRIKTSGFARRCPCLYDSEYGFLGYETHSFSGDDDVDDYDVRNSVDGCEFCGGSGNHDPLPQLLELTDDKAAERWVAEELPRSSGPCDHWTGFPETGWYYDALGYNRQGKGVVRGVTVCNPNLMLGGVITWLEIADLFRPRSQDSLF
jgi:hypothetical protein